MMAMTTSSSTSVKARREPNVEVEKLRMGWPLAMKGRD